jgi:hypothetical protein
MGPFLRRFWAPFTAALLLAVATTLVLRRGPHEDRAGVAAPGGGASGPASDLNVGCLGGSLSACPRGATLLFGLRARSPGYLSAWAEPASGGAPVWYFSAEGESPRIAEPLGAGPNPHAIRIGAEHAPGAYVLHVVLSQAPLGKAVLLAPDPPGILASHTLALVIIDPAP